MLVIKIFGKEYHISKKKIDRDYMIKQINGTCLLFQYVKRNKYAVYRQGMMLDGPDRWIFVGKIYLENFYSFFNVIGAKLIETEKK
jgi:hypothetical protein